mmetsp:Transcript_115107/g.245966  ORF Transcript_115107/g.245966 Transcript_115107/m.245966 type:complete len:1031 (+) Transcript_115107:46-3138(+)
MAATSLTLARPRRGCAPESDVQQGSPEEVGLSIVQCLAVKGFCVLNGFMEPSAVSEAASSFEVMDWKKPPVLIQEGLLGSEGSNMIASMGDFESGCLPGCMGVDTLFNQLSDWIGPYQQDILGFRCHHRSLAHMHQASFPDMDETDLTDKEANEWIAMFACRKIMVLAFLGPGKGTLELRPWDDEANSSELTTEAGLVVLLRTDQLNMTFFNRGNEVTHCASCFLLQQDIMRLPKVKYEEHMTPPAKELEEWIFNRLREIKEIQSTEEELGEEAEIDQSEVPRSFWHAANRAYINRSMVAVRGMSCRMPNTFESEVAFLAACSGSDLVVEVPYMRWDHSTIYAPNHDCYTMDPPRTNCKHASFTDGIELFDNKLFGLSTAEVKGMDPTQRLTLEVTYDSLHRSGMKKGTLVNSSCGMYVGMGSSEWNSAERSADMGIFGATGGAPSICAGRLSFCLGCKGASLAIDTEAASGLTCTFFAAESVEKKGTGYVQDLACGIGSSLVIAKAWWPAHSAAGFLCAEGRCFTFDASAGGHVRCEGVGTITLRRRNDVTVDGEEVLVDEGLPLEGTILGGGTTSSGRSASMGAPNSPVIQQVMAEACRRSGIMPSDVDNVQGHFAAKLLYDAIELAACVKSLRDEGTGEVLVLSTGKTNMGNGIECGGIHSMLRTLHSIKWGIIAPNIHLQQMNAHIGATDVYDTGSIIPDEALEFDGCVFQGVSAFGFGGTAVHMHAFGGADEELRPPPQPTPEVLKPKLTYWPAGGGEVESWARPRSGYFVLGTFNAWTAEKMEYEGEGCYGYSMTLGLNRWEQFQIHLDDDAQKLVHPGSYKAGKGSMVHGPAAPDAENPEAGRSCTWFIDGRSAMYTADPTRSGMAIADSGSAVASGGGEMVEVGTEDKGRPGDQYRIRLHTAGKWRAVSWTKIANAEAKPPPMGTYYVIAEWNGYEPQQMTQMRTPGLFTLDTKVTSGEGRFTIMRDMDQSQIIYPVDGEIFGPDDPPNEPFAWVLPRGRTFRIEFQRDQESMKVSWVAVED